MDLLTESAELLELYRQAGKMLVTAESCTGGLIAATLTEVPGSSDVVERGFVTYSNAAKAELLEVPASLITDKGAVSAEVAEAMAKGALLHSRGDVAVSVTGVAGPGGGSTDKPVGLVFFGVCRRDGEPRHERCLFDGDRGRVRQLSVETALQLLRQEVA